MLLSVDENNINRLQCFISSVEIVKVSVWVMLHQMIVPEAYEQCTLWYVNYKNTTSNVSIFVISKGAISDNF